MADDEVVAKLEESQPINGNIDIIEDDEPLPVDDLSKDKDYEQVDEADDETTMEEEEALPELEDPLREIRFLEEESNMPIHELMVMYGYSKTTPPRNQYKKEKEKEDEELV
ncbi:mesoderm induction early response protein 1 isoform X2 [Acyrthosiphon pisum]|uniref:Uncharacterized protein n=1 Tax=Acyrthosiphon pisum TaxID=7029 RepID=A0A8R2FAW7_ACYPI|nr:mesoderm induction early response protein 1 isoform X2 [Acyrthosiphon pisum]|eukprot:XP_008184286.1 PREDICTED: mesoderm induction early response protein 1-like [Acyrthosiphon pisum]